MVNQINELFVLVEQAFANERNFTSDASHELRTPLAGMLTQVQVAQQTPDENEREQALQKAEKAVGQMNHLVEQLLTLSRVQHNIQLDKQPTDLHQAIIATITNLDSFAHRKHIDIELESQPGMMVVANPPLLNILLRNLLDNAIKYTPEGGRILVTLNNAQADALTLTVEDSGPGVADDEYSRLTQRFYRSDETRQLAEGSGLGLSIVQRILRLHAADIEFAKSQLGGLKASVHFQP
jgi:two-component system sensor histidine kinase QseC